MKLDWRKIYFGKVHSKEVLEAVKDAEWQSIRRSIKGCTLEFKYKMLLRWLELNKYSCKAQVQVTNYCTSLVVA